MILRNIKSLYQQTKYLLLTSILILSVGILFGIYLQSQADPVTRVEVNHTTFGILENNIKASVPFILGFFSLGLTTVTALLINGVSIGSSIVAGLDYLSAVEIILLLVPHGILEVPAILFSASIGFYSTKLLIQFLRNKRIEAKKEIKTLAVLSFITLCLYISAAIIEANITVLFKNH